MPYGDQPSYGGYRPVRPRPTITAPRSPNNRAGPLGVGPTPLGLSTRTAAKPGFTQDQVNASLAANPNASRGGYEGVGPTWQAAQQQPQQPAAPAAPNLSYDYSADPILNQIKALSSQSRTDAQSNALMLRKQLAIDYGDPAIANQFGEPATAEAAAANPFGVRQQLKRGYDQGVQNLDEQYNQQNLFYGGARAKGLGDFANQYQGQLAGVTGQEQSALGGINTNLAAALAAADAQDLAAQQNAAGQALQTALAYGIDPGAGTPITPADVAAITPTAIPGIIDTTQLPPPEVNTGAFNPDPIAAYNTGYTTPSGAPVGLGQSAAALDPLLAALSQQNKRRLMQWG